MRQITEHFNKGLMSEKHGKGRQQTSLLCVGCEQPKIFHLTADDAGEPRTAKAWHWPHNTRFTFSLKSWYLGIEEAPSTFPGRVPIVGQSDKGRRYAFDRPLTSTPSPSRIRAGNPQLVRPSLQYQLRSQGASRLSTTGGVFLRKSGNKHQFYTFH